MEFLRTDMASFSPGKTCTVWRPGLEMAQSLLLFQVRPRRSCLFSCIWYRVGACRAYNEKTTEEQPRFRKRFSNRDYKHRRARDGDKDHYRVLGVGSNATVRDIKVAFRQLARQYHPDVNKDTDADEKFKTIRLAYEVLSDKTSRNAYDHSLRLQAQAARRKTFQNHQSGYYREHKVSTAWSSQQSGNAYWRATDYEDTWEFSSAGYFKQRDAYGRSGNVFCRNKAGGTRRESNCRGGSETREKNRGIVWAEGWDRKIVEVLCIFCLVSFICHAFGAQVALTYFVFFIPHNEQYTAGYRLASVVAWLIGGKRGLALQFGIATTRWLFGKAYGKMVAVVLLALWIGGHLTRVIPLPRGAILFMTYLCIGMS